MVRPTFQLPNKSVPVFGPQGCVVNFDFTATQSISSDLGLEQMSSAIDFVQSIFIDNRLNAQAFAITFGGSPYTIQVKSGRQGIWPVIVPNGKVSFTAISAGGIVVPTIMYNVEQSYFFWDV